MVDPGELATIAVGVLAAAVTGAATGVGEQAGAAVAQVVRERLGASERGRAALTGLDAGPDDPAAREEAEAVLREEVTSDPGLARTLALHLRAPEVRATGSVVITGSRVARTQIALGPLTVNNTSAGRTTLGAVIVLALLVVVLAVYGGVRLLDTTEDSPSAAPPGSAPPGSAPPGSAPADPAPAGSASVSSAAPAPAAALPPTPETVRRILPDRASLDAGEYPWADRPEVRASAAGLSLCERAPECERTATAVGVVTFARGENEGENRAEFLVLAFPDPAAAHRAYADIVEDIEQVRVPTFVKVELARRGEESQGLAMDPGDTGAVPTARYVNRSLLFREGPFIGVAHQLDDPTGRRTTRVLGLADLLLTRVERANAGEVP
ncbi:hypothetical protein AB0O01_02720 [Streptomyces sp. NPDC093252]|uniref:hypothetical protein n=1 Tax=Streptomyces sp. NPDC093252 TaxID=3154980 RepID=UPI00343AF91D